METATVTFKSDSREIAIKFEYNKETQELDYDFVNVPEISEHEESDLVTVLANYFLNSLISSPAD